MHLGIRSTLKRGAGAIAMMQKLGLDISQEHFLLTTFSIMETSVMALKAMR
jgi:hypothetical protein